jgi:hypothetical protein
VADDAYLYAALFVNPARTEFWRMPLSGGGFSVEEGGLLLGEARSSIGLGVNDDYLVSLEARPTPRTVRRIITRFDKQTDALGGELVATIDSLFSDAFALDDQSAYVAPLPGLVGEIVRVSVAGSEPPASVTSGESEEGFTDVAVSGDHLVFASREGVGWVPSAGGESFILSTARAYRVQTDSEFAYYFASELPSCEDGSELYRVPLAGGIPFQLASEPTPGCIGTVVADADALYWLSEGGALLRKVSKH